MKSRRIEDPELAEKYMLVFDAQNQLKISRQMVYLLIRLGKISTGPKIRGLVTISKESVVSYQQKRKEK